MPRRRRSSARGASLIEVMIAMAVLTVGLLAMWNLHMVGLTSNAAGRRHTIATALARELVSGLERLPFKDPLTLTDHPLLTDTVTGKGPLPNGALFGNLVDGGGNILAGAHEWDDATHAVPGVRLQAQLRENAEGQGFERRWSVWGFLSPRALAGAPSHVKIIAVSVVWRDPPFARPREVVVYTQVMNPASLASAMGAP